MCSKEVRIVENEKANSTNMDMSELTLAEEVFTQLQIHSEGIKPSFFTNKDLANLSLTSKPLSSVAFYELHQRVAQILLTHVVKGEQNKAESLIGKNPGLLLIKSRTEDYSGRTIIGTAFQAALGAGDTPMWEIMLPYFNRLEREEALRQFDEQFGTTSDFDLRIDYNALAFAIINNEDKGLSMIEGFRKKITSPKKITQGNHFNLQHLSAAYRAYIDNFDALGNWDSRDFFWQKVIGYVQRQMTAYDAQIHCSRTKDISNILTTEKSFERRLDLTNGGNFFPLTIDSGLGFDFTVYGYARASSWTTRMPKKNLTLSAAKSSIKFIELFFRAKTDVLARLRMSLEQKMFYKPN